MGNIVHLADRHDSRTFAGTDSNDSEQSAERLYDQILEIMSGLQAVEALAQDAGLLEAMSLINAAQLSLKDTISEMVKGFGE